MGNPTTSFERKFRFLKVCFVLYGQVSTSSYDVCEEQTRKQDAPLGPSLKLDTDVVINDLTGKMSSFELGVPRVWRSFPRIERKLPFLTPLATDLWHPQQ